MSTTDRSDRQACYIWQPMWLAFSQAYQELASPAQPAAEQELRRELLFCLLGGHGVTFEVNCSALAVIDPVDVFDADHDQRELELHLASVLGEPRFEPRRKDGSLRRYRFPRRKATLLCQARRWLLETGDLAQHLAVRACEHDRRDWLLGCPGLGPKSASWMLRNTGWAESLAIIDVHVMRAMEDAGWLPDVGSRSDYAAIEQRFLDWCEELDARPGVFDLFLWEWQRGTLHQSPQLRYAP